MHPGAQTTSRVERTGAVGGIPLQNLAAPRPVNLRALSCLERTTAWPIPSKTQSSKQTAKNPYKAEHHQSNSPPAAQPLPRDSGPSVTLKPTWQKRPFLPAPRRRSPSFLTSFLFLLSFFRASMSMWGMSTALASSQCCWSPRTHTENLGRGVDLSLRLGDGAGAGHARPGRGRRRRGLGPRRSLTQRVRSPAASLASQTSRRARPRPPHASPLVSRPRVGVRPATPAGSRGPRCQPDGAREALVLLGVIVLQADLQLHRLQKPWGQAASAVSRPPGRPPPARPPRRPPRGSPRSLPPLALVPVQDFPHRLVQGVAGDFAAAGEKRDERSGFQTRGHGSPPHAPGDLGPRTRCNPGEEGLQGRPGSARELERRRPARNAPQRSRGKDPPPGFRPQGLRPQRGAQKPG